MRLPFPGLPVPVSLFRVGWVGCLCCRAALALQTRSSLCINMTDWTVSAGRQPAATEASQLAERATVPARRPPPAAALFCSCVLLLLVSRQSPAWRGAFALAAAGF